MTLQLGAVQASAEAVTRVEQGDPRITYSGNWYANESASHSGGAAALTNAPGARVTITFTGTGITWIGVADGWSGLATVFLDGAMTVVDGYSATGRQQYPLFAAVGLLPGPHTLSIEVTHERGPGTEGSWVWIDAFDIADGEPILGGVDATMGRVEENHPALLFSGRWYPNTNTGHSGGYAVLATDAGSRASIGFSGTGVAWVAYRDEWSGVARVYVDGQLKTEIDTYLAPARTGMVPYSVTGLAAGPHTLTIEVTGTHNQSAKGSWIWIDGFDIVP